MKSGWVSAILLFAAAAQGADWTAWRGPLQNGVSLEVGLPSSTKDVAWQAPFGGRSTPAVLDGRVFGINLHGQGVMEQEQVFALDLATGKPLWHYRFNVFHTDVPNTRVGWSNVTADPETGYVYAHGVQGLLLCLDRNGKLVWSRSLTEQFGRVSGYGGRTHTPVIDEDRLIISFVNSSFGSHAVGAHRYLALDKRTGEILWWSAPGGKPEDTTYSTPVVAQIAGRRLLIAGNADGGVYAILSRTGQKVWGFRLSQRGLNTAAVVDDYRVYATHGDENFDSAAMGRVVCIDGRGTGDVTKTHELWRADGVDAGYASPLLCGGRLYVMSNSGILHCFDGKTGHKIWQFSAGRIGKGSPVWADGKIYLTTANGTFVILKDEGSSCRQLDSIAFDMGRDGNIELFGSPAVADGRVLFFTTTGMLCLGGKEVRATTSRPATVVAAAQPRPNAEAPAARASPAAATHAEHEEHIQPGGGQGSAGPELLVRPAEVLLRPNASQQFKAFLYDASGRPKPVEAQWSVTGKGASVSGDGAFRAGGHAFAGEVKAAAGQLQAVARVRVVPDLPIAEDFESYGDGELIGWWIGVSKAKYAIESLGGSRVLKKIADDRGPMFNRSHVFVTPPIKAGYTVEADVMGAKVGRRRGDVGLINDRYVLELFGGVQRLRVMSWIPGPRFEKRIDFAWAPDRWYRTKFQVEADSTQARLSAKVWPRGQAEPSAWTIEAEDPQPNPEGAAGLYANSMAPVYFDNVKIYRDNVASPLVGTPPAITREKP